MEFPDAFDMPVPAAPPVAPAPAAPPAPVPAPTPEEPLPKSDPLTALVPAGSCRKGKVARKPKAVRDRINQMLLDGVRYLDIAAALGEDGKDLNEDNLSRWRAGGYQEWLREQEVIEAQRGRNEMPLDLAQEKGSKIHQATIQVAAANLCHLLVNLDPCQLREILEEDPDKYTRLLNALVRLSDGQLRCEQHQSKQAQLTKPVPGPNQGGISKDKLDQAKEALSLM